MAEILATMVVGPLVSMVKDKASSYLLEQYNVMEGMEEQHEVLKRKLPAIMDVIADAEMQAAKHREGAKAWLEAVRKVAYQANDVFDEFKYEALRRKAKKEGHYRKLGMHVIKLFPTHNSVVFRYRMGNKLRFILQAIEVLIAEMNAFRFEFRPEQQPSMKWRQTDPNIIDPLEIASSSRDGEKKKVIDTLLGQGGNVELTVLPFVGMGGLGKTTLAQLVYNDSEIQKHFQMLLWVCVSDNFDVDFLAKSIVEASANDKNNGSEDKKPPLDKLREVVSGKRYLLVLDDVWNHDTNKWEKLKSCLQHGSMGSCVLTTTRDEAIAKFMGTIEAYKLNLLDRRFIEEIIKTKAFTSKDVSPTDEQVKIIGDLASKCSGSPLAATALGSLLCTKSSVEEWEVVLKKSTICDDETGILPVLKLSYNDLPSQMRQCFSFCAMFPKDYEIDVEMLIQLWMANGFILDEQRVPPEIRGRQIFNELLSRSFFQDKKEITFGRYKGTNYFLQKKINHCSRITFKIHDLMHDVAQSAMGKECATLAIAPSKREDFPYSSRHLFVSHQNPEVILSGCLEQKSPALQTLFCTGSILRDEKLQYISKYNTIRALKIRGRPSLEPKYLHHLRYLDLSRSDIEALPEDISILYHLQTLNLSHCYNIVQLPNEMKYMTALRHLYTHGCEKLKMMPPELRCLTSLQKLTWFVAGTIDSICSNLGELGLLDDLGGHLEVRHLKNVTEEDAKKANLGNKKRLEELTLRWQDRSSQQELGHQDKVLEGLNPHDGIKVLRIYSYGGSTYPTWINTLQHIVELVLDDCNKLGMLPPLWRLPALQYLYISGPENVHFFCDGDRPPFTFKKLKKLILYNMSNLEAWWDINKVQVQDPIFPEVEKLSVIYCKMLPSLPSPFPALKELKLSDLTAFQRWEEAVEKGTLGEHVTTFPCLEKLLIYGSPELITLPDAPKLSVLEIEGGGQQILLHVVRYITSLSALKFLLSDETEETLPIHHSLNELVDDKEKWSHESSALRAVHLGGCNFLFPQLSAPPALWNCLVQLEDLVIDGCNTLAHWPENVFQSLVWLRKLMIWNCNKLTGRAQKASDDQSSTTPGRSVFPPRLESLMLSSCYSLVEVPTLPASLRELQIDDCPQLQSVIVGKQQNTSTVLVGSGDDGAVISKQEKSAPALQGSSEPPILSASNLSPPVPLLQQNSTVWIDWCRNLQSLSVQLDCTELLIWHCDKLKSLDYDDHLMTSLEYLSLKGCKSLESIPDGGPQAYSSLRYLEIKLCSRLKVLPPRLKQRLNDIEIKYLDARYTDADKGSDSATCWTAFWRVARTSRPPVGVASGGGGNGGAGCCWTASSRCQCLRGLRAVQRPRRREGV